LGHALAGLELANQLGAPPDAIVVPLGSGGTTAGLMLAVGWLGWPTRIVTVRVAPALVANRWRVRALAAGAERLLRRTDVSVPHPGSPVPVVVVNALGAGYGHPSPGGEAARRLAAEHGLVLDPTYGAKALAVLLQQATGNVRRAVFWHTFAAP
jgi:1-aminocyclopropane-1-carboxylate deaminase/D-cysteine desulfhydrase-like pyridoxal-dependent ACC family enzyme